MLFRKKPVTIEAITFDELVAIGLSDPNAHIVDGVPLSFSYKGHPITHENASTYLVPTNHGVVNFMRGDMLITQMDGEIYPCKAELFALTYDSAPDSGAPLSFGNKLVGRSFNPANDARVDRLKEIFAEAADIVNEYDAKGTTPDAGYLNSTFKGGAIRKILDAQMWCVKHVTNKG